MNVMEIRGLCKAYPAFTLKDVSFTVPQGAVMGFIGRNGAGKSTTIKSVLGLVHPDAGQVEILGRSFLLHGAQFVQGPRRIASRLYQSFDEFSRFVVFALAEKFFSFGQTYLAVVGIKPRPNFEGLIGRFFVVCFLRNVKGAPGRFGRASLLRRVQKSLPSEFRIAGLYGEFADKKTADNVRVLRGFLRGELICAVNRVRGQRRCGVYGGKAQNGAEKNAKRSTNGGHAKKRAIRKRVGISLLSNER